MRVDRRGDPLSRVRPFPQGRNPVEAGRAARPSEAETPLGRMARLTPPRPKPRRSQTRRPSLQSDAPKRTTSLKPTATALLSGGRDLLRFPSETEVSPARAHSPVGDRSPFRSSAPFRLGHEAPFGPGVPSCPGHECPIHSDVPSRGEPKSAALQPVVASGTEVPSARATIAFGSRSPCPALVCARPSGAEAPVGEDVLPSPAKSEGLAEPDICPLRLDPKILLDRTCRSPRWNPKIPAGSSDSARALRNPKVPSKHGGCNPTRREPKLLARRTSYPIPPTPEGDDAHELLRPCSATRRPCRSRRASRCLPPKPKKRWSRARHPPPPEARRPRLEPNGPSASAPKPEDSVWNRTALTSPGPKSLRAEHLRSLRRSRSPLGPNERWRWPQELPRLQGFDPRGNPPLTCRLFRPARGA
jgi:hypothetical protein